MQKILIGDGTMPMEKKRQGQNFTLANPVDYLLKLRVFMHSPDPHSTTTVWQAISRCLMWAVTIVCVCIGLALFRPQMSRRAKLDAEIADLRRQKEVARLAVEAVQKECDWLKSEPEYLEAYARDYLDLGRVGEMIFRFQPAN
jgi:cell division protein FtsB